MEVSLRSSLLLLLLPVILFLPVVMAAIWLDHPSLSQFKTRVTDSEHFLPNSVILLDDVSAADAQVP